MAELGRIAFATDPIMEARDGREGFKIRVSDKLDALKQLGLQLGMFQKVSLGSAENPLIAFVQSLQGTALPLGHQQPLPAPQAQAAPEPAPAALGVSAFVRTGEPEISPLLRPRSAA